MPESIFSLDHISFSYAGSKPLFTNLSLTLAAGQRIGLYGANGAGKTTLFRIIMGLERPQSGSILLHGTPLEKEKDFRALRRKVGLVLQNADDQLFCPTVLEDVSFGPLNLGLSQEEADRKARTVLMSLGLSGYEDRLTHQLSGGEKKLVSLAGILAMEPVAMLLDEPTAALDENAVRRLADILAGLPHARIVISHDKAFLEQVSESILILKDGMLIPSSFNTMLDKACSID